MSYFDGQFKATFYGYHSTITAPSSLHRNTVVDPLLSATKDIPLQTGQCIDAG
jgi:hypothetical protein